MSMVQKGDEGVDIGAAPATTADDLVVDYWHRVLGIVQASIRAYNESKGQFAFLEEGVVRRYGIEGTSQIFARFVCEFRGCGGGVGWQVDRWRRVVKLRDVEGLGDEI